MSTLIFYSEQAGYHYKNAASSNSSGKSTQIGKVD